MVVIITGASHTGKTVLAQKLLERYNIPYMSLDHLKMGFIRSKFTDLTVYDDEKLTVYMWPVIREMIKTVIENNQNLIIEGCYIPFDWKDDFTENYLKNIKYICLVMSKSYIENNFGRIKEYACTAEKRADDDCTAQMLIKDNARCLEMCRKYGNEYILIDKDYNVDLEFIL